MHFLWPPYIICQGVNDGKEVEIYIEAHQTGRIGPYLATPPLVHAAATRYQDDLLELQNYSTAKQISNPLHPHHQWLTSRDRGLWRTGRPRSGRHSISPEDIRYGMDVVVQPPRTARVGQVIPGSLIVQLRTTNADPDDAVADSPNFVAVATLIPGPNSTASTDPSVLNQLLAGRRFDSIHPFADDEADGSITSMDMADPRGVGYMRFPDLVIRQAGTFRLRITLLRTGSAGSGSAVQIVDSNPIVVYGSGPSSNLAACNGKYMVATR
ncbi:hypothetical protein P153DRAFT_427473 [Dothidotthia symphoricarpi CBS 119687]|uniref:Velvet domain-containing protein n=1 Tax=Dothidotthia symphoricarpi CBS 119687 TaxID=1392245 RepID=A0A6A6AUF8_9PLEO|nr:uncharacterized protein P153DRAFT_427473 [Dothidotthia symphoricarpi CBS 119687]KAF2134853.1 hypothetical protein P153DRAFT_427473 [Dothidotthia symphoricarpi CBS 119687]